MNLTRWRSPTEGTSRGLDFHYGPLVSSKTGIRLAQILPGSGSKAIAISLVDSYVSGPVKIPYDALSYTWGDGSRSKTVFCNGKRLAVTQTLLEALHRFRDPDHVVTLWIDQICICQERIKERNQQVQMMGDIFKAANKVIVWLGDEYDDSRAGMQLARQLLTVSKPGAMDVLAPKDLEIHGLPKQGHKRWKALAAILRRPWFWRAWIVQEVVLNPRVELVLGSSMLTWEELELIVGLLEGPIPRSWQLDAVISASELPFSRINRIRIRHQSIQGGRRSIEVVESLLESVSLFEEPRGLEGTHGDDPDLLDLLLLSRSLGATDPRDKIYALLGLSKHDISPDYSMPPESVFTDFALQTIGLVTYEAARHERTGLKLSVYHRDVRRAIIMLACAGRHNQSLKLPSWVPDWTVNLASRPLIFGMGTKYAAGGSELGLFDWHPDFGLQLDGILIDTIQVVGNVLLTLESGVEPRDMIAAWWLEACEIAGKRVARSPGSTDYTDAFEAMRRRLSLCKHGYYVGESRSRRRGSILDDSKFGFDAGHSALQTLTLGPTRGRVVFATSTGYLGLAPHGTKEGDLIFVIRGVDVPFVLRPLAEGYELIGESFVQGIMEGEALALHNFILQDVMVR